MKRNIVVLSLLIASCIAQASETETTTNKKRKKVVVAVIDTGIDLSLMKNSWICPEGHKDFTGVGLHDNHGHGTHISGLVDQYAKNFVFSYSSTYKNIDKVDADYCQIIIKYFDPKVNSNNLENTIKSFRWAIDKGVDIINYSGGGLSPDEREQKLIKEALDKGIKVVAAAGNEKSNIDEQPYFPAMYDKRIYVVGNLVSNKVEIVVTNKVDKNTRAITEIKVTKRDIASSSNYGININAWEIGTSVLSRLPNGKIGHMTGTSQSAAIHTGKLIRKQLNSSN